MQERRTAVICSTTVLRLLYSGIRLVIIIIVVVVVVIIIIIIIIIKITIYLQ